MIGFAGDVQPLGVYMPVLGIILTVGGILALVALNVWRRK